MCVYIYIYIHTHTHTHIYVCVCIYIVVNETVKILLCIYLATMHSIRDPSSSSRDQICAPALKYRDLTTEPPGKSLFRGILRTVRQSFLP